MIVRIVIVRLEIKDLIFFGNTPLDIQLLTFLLLSNISELGIGEKTKYF